MSLQGFQASVLAFCDLRVQASGWFYPAVVPMAHAPNVMRQHRGGRMQGRCA